MFENPFKKKLDPETVRTEVERNDEMLKESEAFLKEMRKDEIVEKERRDAFLQEKLGEITNRKDGEAA